MNRLIQFLLVNGQDAYGETPAMDACAKNDIHKLRACIDAGADLSIKNAIGETAANIAIMHGSTGCLQAILDRYPDVVNEGMFGSGYTLLFCAVSRCEIDCVRLLLERGADVNLTDCHGDTALHCIGEYRDDNGDFVFHPDMPAVCDALLEKDANLVRVRTRMGQTALHEIAHTNYVDVALRLLQAGADPREKNNAGISPLDLAEHPEMIEVMRAFVLGAELEN